jgi:hypothetical protein
MTVHAFPIISPLPAPLPTRTASRAGVALFVALVLAAVAPPGTTAQQTVIQTPPNRGGQTVSMGLPPTWRWSLGGTTGINRLEGNDLTFYLNAGVYKDFLLAPVTSALGLLFEGYVGRRGSFDTASESFDGGFRVSAYSPAVRFAGGYDYNFRDQRGDFILSLIHPIQRGGVFTDGGSLRIDWLPTRNHTTNVGFHFPVGQRWVGVTRPRHDYVRLPYNHPPEVPFAPDSALSGAMESVRELGRWVTRTTVPFTDQWDGSKDEALRMFVEEMSAIEAHMASDGAPYYPGNRTPIRDTEAFHDELERAFSIAASGRDMPVGQSTAVGRAAAERARREALDEVIFPYNRLLGQKRRKDSTYGFANEAAAGFFEWITSESQVPRGRVLGVVWVFSQYMELMEETRATQLNLWDEERFVWLPYQLALRPEEHDEQEELNALVERAVQGEFVRGNELWYVENEQWQIELARMILEAEDYHVVWLHDFRGLDAQGEPDEMSFRQVTQAYLPALINAARRYDDTGKIPQYIQIFDMFYFSSNYGELWVELLEDPMRHEVNLPRGFEMWEDSIASLQGQLRDAVEGSQLLQAQKLLFGDDWLFDLVKVHTNVTQPPDASFWSAELFPSFMGLPDTPIRDHRKIAFFDISEADPYKGRAIYTGMGVGEHYIGAGWEDRAMMVEGPAGLQLRDAARRLLLNQGFEEWEIPWELQPKPLAPDYMEKVDRFLAERGDYGSTMETHNEIGYRPKGVSLLKATLYTLMPPGAVIKAPDSIWGSNLWGSMMLGHALRGGRSLVIAPAIANAPSPGSPQMSRAQEAMTRLVVADQILGDHIEAQGGLMKVGLYSTDLDVGDIPGKIGALLDQLSTVPWLADLYDFDPGVLEGLREEREELIAEGFERVYTVDQEVKTAKLHMKAHLYMSREMWEDFLSLPGLEDVIRAHSEEMAELNRALSRDEYRDFRAYSDRLDPLVLETGRHLLNTPADRYSRYVGYLLVGSHNQNSRSLALDGEVAVVAAKWKALNGLMDFITVVGLCTWVEDVETLEELFPGYDGLARRVSRWIRMMV